MKQLRRPSNPGGGRTLAVAFGVVLSAFVIGAAAQAARPVGQNAAAAVGELELLPVQGNIQMLAGAGGNITVQVGKDGVLLVDSGAANMSEKALDAIRTLSRREITYIVNTSDRADHVGGNERFVRASRPLAMSRLTQARVYIIGYNTLLERMSDRKTVPPVPEAAWPNDTHSAPLRNLAFNDEAIQILHQPATTDGDSIVLFRRADVISTGDIFDPSSYPLIELKKGGSLQGIAEGLFRLKQMAIPADHQEGGTMIIPGHGRLCDAADLAVYQQMVTIVGDRLQSMIKRGMTLEQVVAARPTRDYDPIYGHTTGSWTTNMFVEAAYKSLTSTAGTSGRASN